MDLSVTVPFSPGPEGQASRAVAHSARQNPDAHIKVAKIPSWNWFNMQWTWSLTPTRTPERNKEHWSRGCTGLGWEKSIQSASSNGWEQHLTVIDGYTAIIYAVAKAGREKTDNLSKMTRIWSVSRFVKSVQIQKNWKVFNYFTSTCQLQNKYLGTSFSVRIISVSAK